MRSKIVAIVEGHGEVEALPILLQKIVTSVAPEHSLAYAKPLRVARGQIVQEQALSRYVTLAAAQAGADGAILILADEDEDCAKELAQSMLAMNIVRTCAVPIGVVFAVKCYETWFLESAGSFAGALNFPGTLAPPERPAEELNPKRWLERHSLLNAGESKRWSYSERVDQPRLTHRLDIPAARQNRSFDKLHREVVRLLTS